MDIKGFFLQKPLQRGNRYILVVMDMITCAAEMIPITDKSAKTVACAVVHNILFILPLGAQWLEWCSIHSGIGMRNRKTRTCQNCG